MAKTFIVQAVAVATSEGKPTKYNPFNGTAYCRVAAEEDLSAAAAAVQAAVNNSGTPGKVLVAEVNGIVAPSDVKIVPLPGITS